MNIFHRVTLESLRKNRTRTLVTIIGILLSAALICAVTTSVASFLNYATENIIYMNGSWHAAALNTDHAEYETLSGLEEIADTVYAQQLGYADIKSMNEYKPYLFLLGTGKGFEEMLPIHLTYGEYPKTSNEILLPEHLAENGGRQYRLGDVLTLELGTRTVHDDGYPLYQNTPCYVYTQGYETEMNGETLNIRESRTYTVVGFYERPGFEPYTAPGYTALTVADPDITAATLDVYYTVHQPKEIYHFLAEHELNYDTNDNLLMTQGSFQLDGMYGTLYGLAAVFIGLIVFGSVSLIYNAFSISVSERTKQFGLLSSVGATRKQLRRMVFFESITVAAIGIPLGILCGIAGIAVTLLLIGHKFSSLFETGIPMRICVSPTAILIACIIALLTVLISAWIPSRRATKVSAVEAIRQTQDIQAGKKPIRTPKMIYRLFGLSGMLAHKNYKRSRKKYRATVVSLFMSIVLFISASAFTDYLIETAESGFSTYGYDLRFYFSPADREKESPETVLEHIRSNSYVDAVTHTQVQTVMATVPDTCLSTDALEFFEKTDSKASDSESRLHTTIYFVDEASFSALLKEYQLEESKYTNPDAPLAIAIDGYRAYDFETERYINLNVLNSDNASYTYVNIKEFDGYDYAGLTENSDGTHIYRYRSTQTDGEYMELPESEATVKFPLKSGKTIDKQPYFVSGNSDFYLIYPQNVMESVVSEDIPCYSHCFLMLSKQHGECFKSLKKQLAENTLTATNLTDYAAEAEQERNLITIIQVFSYGFIILISLIAAANVFHTISTNISLRRREFAMLKSIGMTGKGFHQMMNFECILYGTKALILGLPVSFGVTYLIYLAVAESFGTGFRLPLSAIGIAVCSVFLVVFSTMLYAMSKIRKDNPIEALKNENI